MIIVTWNCNGALRKKTSFLDTIDADIFVIQECENPNTSITKYKKWASNFLWVGHNKNKGIGVFVKKNISLAPLNWQGQHSLHLVGDENHPLLSWESSQLELFLPCIINNKIPLLAVWTKNNKLFPKMSYIGQAWLYLQQHKNKLSSNQIICGDFNSNAWNAPRK